MKKIFDYYKNLDIKIKASFWFIVCSCFQKMIAFVTTPIYTRIMTEAQYGEYNLFLSWIEFFSILCTLNIFYSAYTVGLNKFESDKDRYTGNVHLLCFILTTIISIILLLWIDFFSKILKMSRGYIISLVLYMYIMPTFQIWSSQQRYYFKYRMLVIVTMLLGICTICVGTLFTYYFENKGQAASIAKVIVEAIISAPLFILNIRRLSNFFDIKYFKYSFKYSIALLPHYLSTMILNHSDRIMISSICGDDKTAIYSVAYSIGMVVSVFITALLNSFIPWLYRKLSAKSYDGITRASIPLTIISSLLTIIVLIIAPEILLIIAPKTYIEAKWILIPVALGTLITIVYGFFVNIEFFFNFNKMIIIASSVTAGLNIVLNYVFIHKFGYIAAGYTTFFCYSLLLIFHYINYRIMLKVKKIDSKIISIIPHLFIILITIALACVIMFLYKIKIYYRYFFLVIIIAFLLISWKKIIASIKKKV